MSWSSFARAKETVGAHVRYTLEVNMVEGPGAPTNISFRNISDAGPPAIQRLAFWLGDREPWVLDSSATEKWIESGVVDWGVIAGASEFNTAFGTIADVTVIVEDRPMVGQRRNSAYTFASGSPGMNPEPDQYTLTQLLQFYSVLGRAAVIRAYWFTGADTGDTAEQQSLALLSGRVERIDPDGGMVAITIAQVGTAEESTIAGRVITDPPRGVVGKGERVPIVLGQWSLDSHEPGGISGDATIDNVLNETNTWVDFVVAGWHPPMVPVIPFRTTPGDEKASDLIITDYTAPNAGWTDMEWGLGDPLDYTDLFRFDAETGAVSVIDKDTTSPAAGYVEGIEDSGGAGLELFQGARVRGQMRAQTYVPCIDLAASGGFTPTNPERAYNRKVWEKFSMPIGTGTNGDYIMFRIAEIQALGTIIKEDNAITAYCVLADSGTAGTNGPWVRFGLWSVSENQWIDGQSGARTPYADLGDAQLENAAGAGGLITQAALAAQPIQWESYFEGRFTGPPYEVGPEPLLSWQWRYSDIGGVSSSAYDDVYVRFEVIQESDAEDTIDIVDVGVRVHHFVKDVITVNRTGATSYQGVVPFGSRGGRDVGRGSRDTKQRGRPRLSDSGAVTCWAMPHYTVRDNDAGDLSGTADQFIVNPIEHFGYLALAWSQGPPTVRTGSAAFGGVQLAANELGNWIVPLSGNANHWKITLASNGEPDLAELANRIAAQAPVFFDRSFDGELYAVTYPYASAPNAMRFRGGSVTTANITLHAGTLDPRSANAGKSYGLLHFRPYLTPLSEIYNRFKVNYRPFHPISGDYEFSQVVTETDADSNVYADGFPRATGAPSDYASDLTLTYDFSEVCSDSQDRYGVIREMPPIEMPDTSDHRMVTAFIHYLVKRFTHQRMMVDASLGIEGCDMERGHVIKFDDDCNLLPYPRMDFLNEPAKATGWSTLDFMVKSVRKFPLAGGQMRVDFTAEQIVYDPS